MSESWTTFTEEEQRGPELSMLGSIWLKGLHWEGRKDGLETQDNEGSRIGILNKGRSKGSWNKGLGKQKNRRLKLAVKHISLRFLRWESSGSLLGQDWPGSKWLRIVIQSERTEY